MNKTLNERKLVMAVSNDLVTDNRVHKMAITLTEMGFSVTVVGRCRPQSLPVSHRPYQTERFRLPFHHGPFFYASLNLWLFFYLLFRRFDTIWSNDLDTLPACYLDSKLTRRALVYDSHELFTEVPELVTRPGVKKIWTAIEKAILPKLTSCITVCQSIADYYEEEYGTRFTVIRNVPFLNRDQNSLPSPFNTTLPVILYQGSVNLGRGIEETILAMHEVEGARLVIIGDGDLFEECRHLVDQEKLSDRVFFTGRLPFEQIPAYTRHASIGLSVEKDMGLNYRYALPNKLFDYIQAGVPVLTSSLPEISNVVTKYNLGITLNEISPKSISNAILLMLSSPEQMEQWRSGCAIAARELCWEREKESLKKVISFTK